MREPLWMLLTSDLHIGSAFALWPQGFRLSTGNVILPNIGQEYLRKNVDIILRKVREKTGGRLDGLVAVGDTVNGPAKERKGDYNVENKLNHQGYAAVEVLYPFREMSDKFWICRGTKWHVGEFAETEDWVGRTLDSEPNPLGEHSWVWIPALDLSESGFILDVGHTQSYTMVNRSMPLERELRYAAIAQDIKPFPDLIIRAHVHSPTYVEVDGHCALGLPPMQLQTSFAQGSKTPNRMLPRWMGMVLLEIYPWLLGTNERPFDYHWMRFRHPPLVRRKPCRRKVRIKKS